MPTPISDEIRADLAIRREAFDLSLAEIRANNGKSYGDRMRLIGSATTDSAASHEDLEKSD